MGGKMSREKGKRGEREFAALCRQYGFDTRRGQQYSGEGGDDVVGLPGIHVEVKRVERLDLYTAMGQSRRDAHNREPQDVPIVAHRKNDCPWLVTLYAEDYLELLQEAKAQQSPCDLCAYDPPSSLDGKPCTMCPAMSRRV